MVQATIEEEIDAGQDEFDDIDLPGKEEQKYKFVELRTKGYSCGKSCGRWSARMALSSNN